MSNPDGRFRISEVAAIDMLRALHTRINELDSIQEKSKYFGERRRLLKLVDRMQKHRITMKGKTP